MKESKFIDQNKDKWLDYERIIKQSDTDPDELSDIFIQITDDLSHSRSNYPNRSVRVYLNDLASKIFDKLGKRKKLDFQVIKDFYTIEVPQLMYLARREMLVAFVIFILSMGIGIYSSMQNPEFASLVLGEGYVEMTKENISKGEAMNVYTGGDGMNGFLRILENNARIDIMMLGLGLFFSFGAIWVLVRNGIMVGVFQYFFWQHGGFKDSLLTIWLHGTIEITTIALMGGVALLAGKGLLFPGTYTRYQSFRLSAGNAGKLLLMVLPFTFVAAVIEGFITRMTGMPDLVKAVFILLSFVLVILYFAVYPRIIHRRYGVNPLHEKLRRDHITKPISFTEIKSVGKVINESFITYKNNFGRNIIFCGIAALIYPILLFYGFPKYFNIQSSSSVSWYLDLLSYVFRDIVGTNSGVPSTLNFTLFKLGYMGFWYILLFFVNVRYAFEYRLQWKNLGGYTLIGFLLLAASHLFINRNFGYGLNYLASFGFILIVSSAVLIVLVLHYYGDGKRDVLKTVASKVFHFAVLWLVLSFVLFFVQLLASSLLSLFLVMAVQDLLPLSAETLEQIDNGLQIAISFLVILGLFPFYIYSARLFLVSLIEKYEAVNLTQEVNSMVFDRK